MAPRRAEGDRVKVLAMLSRGAPASLRRCSRVCVTLYVGVLEGAARQAISCSSFPRTRRLRLWTICPTKRA